MSSSVRHSSLYSGTQPNLQQNEEEEARQIFERWLIEKGKSYKDIGEKEKRFESFKHNLRVIEKHKSNPHRTFELALTALADLTWEEFIERCGNKILTRDWYIDSDQKSRKLWNFFCHFQQQWK